MFALHKARVAPTASRSAVFYDSEEGDPRRTTSSDALDRRSAQVFYVGLECEPVVLRANLKSGQITDNLIAALVQRRMTYGEFNYRRARNVAAYLRFANAH